MWHVCRADPWEMRAAERRLKVLEAQCLRGMAGVTRLDGISKEGVSIRTLVIKELSASVDIVGFGVIRKWVGDG